MIFCISSMVCSGFNFGSKTTLSAPTSSRTGYVTCFNLNVRKSSPTGPVIGMIHRGDSVETFGKSIDEKSYKIKYKGSDAFACTRYITFNLGDISVLPTTKGANTPTTANKTSSQSGCPFDGITTATSLNVRSYPWKSPVLGRLTKDSKVKVQGIQGDWYLIDYRTGTAWVHRDHVKKDTGSSIYGPQPFYAQPGTSTTTAPATTNQSSVAPNSLSATTSSGQTIAVAPPLSVWETNKQTMSNAWTSITDFLRGGIRK
ncbi:SH3 domain-containing protein [bacterium]|nr:SH3 domain-containing protein [bacterium]